jgi:hypothetical protein
VFLVVARVVLKVVLGSSTLAIHAA